MNHQEAKQPNQKSKQHKPWKHALHMGLCCGLPILIVFLLPVIAGFSPMLSGILGFIAPFICPLMMGGMLLAMFRGNQKSNDKSNSCCSNDKEISN